MTFEGHGVNQIRGIQISKILKGFSDEEFTFLNLVEKSTTQAREIRWYKREAGVLDTTDSAGMTASRVDQGAELTLPEVVEQKVERQNSYIKIWVLESPWISEEDFMDSDVQVIALNQKQLPRAIIKSRNDHIYNVLTENQTPVNILTTASTAAWDAASSVAIVKDLNAGIRKIREQNYEPTHLLLSPKDFDSMLTHFIDTKGASIPQFSSDKITSGSVMTVLGLQVVVSNSVVADSAPIAAMKQAVTYWEFSPVSVNTIYDQRIAAHKIIVRARGLALLTDPKCVHLTTNTQT